MSNKIRYTKLERRGYEVVLPTNTYKDFVENGYNIGLIIDKNNRPTSLQLFERVAGKNTYVGTVKSQLGVVGFKNGNPCDFHKSNLIYE